MPDATTQLWKSLRAPRQLVLIAGPCVAESEKLCRQIARALAQTCRELDRTYTFKVSYDKANRTSGKYRVEYAD